MICRRKNKGQEFVLASSENSSAREFLVGTFSRCRFHFGRLRSLATSATTAHPAAEDLASSLAWLAKQAPKFGYDPKKIFVVGHPAGAHMAASLPHVAGDYVGEHWLASFALLALTAGEPVG